MSADQFVSYWRWEVLEHPPKVKRERWRTLRWTMPEDEALSWAIANGREIPATMRKVPNSEEKRHAGGSELRQWNYMAPKI